MDSLVTAISSVEGPLSSLQSRSSRSGSEEGSASGGDSSDGILLSRAENGEDLLKKRREKSSRKRSAQSIHSERANTVKYLKQRCRTAGLAVSGTKQELTARLDFIRTSSTTECQTFRMGSLPLHAGTLRQGSLRVIASISKGRAEEPHLKKIANNTYKIIPGNNPIAVSVLRHDNVFSTDPDHLRKEPIPLCPCCNDPAEVFDIQQPIPIPVSTNISPLISQQSQSQESIPSQLGNVDQSQNDAESNLPLTHSTPNPLYTHLHSINLIPQGPRTYLRVCRKGCLSYQDVHHDTNSTERDSENSQRNSTDPSSQAAS
uniref:SAP domain-containing protein n=1 Tax=Aureoumbra lagunensis TaxID=44058 RepID=A0A7S3JV56_9STRA